MGAALLPATAKAGSANGRRRPVSRRLGCSGEEVRRPAERGGRRARTARTTPAGGPKAPCGRWFGRPRACQTPPPPRSAGRSTAPWAARRQRRPAGFDKGRGSRQKRQQKSGGKAPAKGKPRDYLPKPSIMSTISAPMRFWASTVAAPMWGVQETAGWLIRASLVGGSLA